MVKPPWRDRLRHELNKRGLPATYSARLIEELTDHFADIRNEDLSMDADAPENKIGSPECLAAVAEEEFRRHTFAGRHPFVAFVVAPFSAAILWVVMIALFGKAWGWFIVPESIHAPTILESISLNAELCVLRLSPVALAWLFLRLSRRVGRPVSGLIACGLLAFWALNLRPHVRPGFDVDISFGGFLHYRPDTLIQAALPLALGLWTCWRMGYPTKNSPWRRDPVRSSAPTHT
jgi:hypothetical protein